MAADANAYAETITAHQRTITYFGFFIERSSSNLLMHNGLVFTQICLRADKQMSESQSRVIMNSIPCARTTAAETWGGRRNSVATCAAMQSGEDPQRRTMPQERSRH